MREILIDWNKFKTEVFAANLPVFYEQVAGGTRVYANEVTVTWVTMLTSEADLSEFNGTYATLCNKPGQESLRPVQTLSSNAFQMQADAVSVEVPKGTAGILDFKIQNHDGETHTIKYLAGAEILATNVTNGDWAESQIVDLDNVLGYGAGLVLKTYVRKKFMFNNVPQTITASAPGAIPVGLYIRVVYHSVATAQVNPTIFINYDIEIKE